MANGKLKAPLPRRPPTGHTVKPSKSKIEVKLKAPKELLPAELEEVPVEQVKKRTKKRTVSNVVQENVKSTVLSPHNQAVHFATDHP